MREGDEEWLPERGKASKDEEEEEEDEGVSEGKDSVVHPAISTASESEDMDTIARSVAHPYYLRSLHQPEHYPGAGLPDAKAKLQLPPPPSIVGVATGTTAQTSSYVLPVPDLPPPPMPRGMSAGDLFQSLDARDEDMRKSE